MDFKSHIEKTYLFSWEHRIYIRKDFKSNIEKILCYPLSHIKKTKLFSWEHRVYIWKGFKSHIEKILYYPFQLKYLNQKIFYPTLKKHNFFSWEHRLYILMGFKSHIKKKTGLIRVHPHDPLGWPGFVGLLPRSVFY